MVPLLSRMFSSKTGARISAVQAVFWVGTGEPSNEIIYKKTYIDM